jgi:O-antigen/teichoic acid export membrane protein
LKLQTGLQSLILPFVNMLMPMVSDLWARGQRDEVRRRLTIATRVAVQLTVPVALGVALFAHDIVRVWLGSTAPAATTSIVVVLMAVQIVTLATAPAERVLVGMGRVRAPALLSVLEGTANLSASALLVWRYGAVGAALGTLLTSALLAPVKVPLVCRALGYSTSRFVAETVGRGVAHSIPAALVMVGVFFALPGGAGRFAAGLTLGIVVAVLGAAVEVGPRRLAASLGGRNGGAVPAHTLTPRSEPPAAGM